MDPRKFETQFFDAEAGIVELHSLCSQYDSPEYINDGPETAPSKRIIQVISDYKNRKATAGPAIALEIGIPQMKEKCSHFANWLERLESLR